MHKVFKLQEKKLSNLGHNAYLLLSPSTLKAKKTEKIQFLGQIESNNFIRKTLHINNFNRKMTFLVTCSSLKVVSSNKQFPSKTHFLIM